ncbi:hypothetical protein RhiirC2_755308 [Rhizophagus irregularis]|uniref:Uncharacterized protein n=1 Tax=Rhizophagus irregularis TaxID=588596 RepID=A0A2N1MUL2_9GLOM|nr:hypothetical protein RhiirC2_755308 [Rhizophagus irregularis]
MCPDRHNWPGDDIGRETIMSEGQIRPKNLTLYKGPMLEDKVLVQFRIRIVLLL